MKATIANEACIEHPTQEVRKFFSSILTVKNPEYEKKKRMGLWIGDTPKEMKLYKTVGDSMILPFGMLPEIFLKKEQFESITNAIHPFHNREYQSRIKPYQYQEEAIKSAITARQGVIVAPCGAGKTQIGLELAARIGGRTLWLTHTHELLKQSMERAKANFGMPSDQYGTITNGEVNVGNTLTFATVQTMANVDLTDLKDYFDVVIVDECHHCIGSPTKVMMFYKVLSALSARYKFGLTATPKRADGLEMAMFAIIGRKCAEINMESVKSKTCPVEVVIRRIPFEMDVDSYTNTDGTLNYVKFVTEICKNDKRNEAIADYVATLNGSRLLLTDRVAHINTMQSLLEQRGLRTAAISTKAKSAERELALCDLATGNIDCLIATFALAKEGLDVPTLRNVVFATPQKNATIVQQSAGRVARCADGKQYGIVHDILDESPMLVRWYFKRRTIYKRLDYSIKEC